MGDCFKVVNELSAEPPKSSSRRKQSRDVRQELIDEALKILSEEGLEELTLRKVAARIGVSHAAPAHHFRGMPHLLGCVVGIGFKQLADSIRVKQKDAQNDPHEQLVALCEAYVAFARENSGLMALMFNTDRERVEKADMHNSGQEAYALLKEACAPFEPIGDAPDSTETHVWSLVHGMAFLHLGGRFDNPGRVTGNPSVADVLPRLKLRK